jgi:hypothetical protein
MTMMISQTRIPSWTRAPEGDGGGQSQQQQQEPAAIDYAALDYSKIDYSKADYAGLVATLPDDLKGSLTVTRHSNLADLVNSAVAAEKRLGAPADQLLRLPTKDEEIPDFAKAVYQRLGAPETADGYKLEWEGQSDDDKAMAGKFAAFMFDKAGAPPPAVLAAAAEFWRGEVAAAEAADAAAITANAAEAETKLKAEYGAKYDDAVKAVGKVVAELGGQELADELDLGGGGNNPALFRLLHKFSEKLIEGGGPGPGNPDVGKAAMTPSEAYAARSALEGDDKKRKALMDKSDPMHAAVVEERNKYLRFENPQAFAAAQAAS